MRKPRASKSSWKLSAAEAPKISYDLFVEAVEVVDVGVGDRRFLLARFNHGGARVPITRRAAFLGDKFLKELLGVLPRRGHFSRAVDHLVDGHGSVVASSAARCEVLSPRRQSG